MNSPYQPGQPAPEAQPTPAPKRRRRWPWIVGGVIVVIIIISSTSKGGNNTPQPTGAPLGNQATTAAAPTTQAQPAAQPPAKPAEHVVVYKVTGTGKASVTYVTDGMTTQSQESDVSLPWTSADIKLPKGKALQMVSVLAQGDGTGAVKVTITVDGKLYKEASATGYGVASANGNIGTMG